MLNNAERIESLAHKLIDKAAQVAAGIAKALVTLICLGSSLAYTAGVKAGQAFYRTTHKVSRPATSNDAENSADTNTVQETEPPVDEVKPTVINEQPNQPQAQDLNVALTEASIASKEIVDICHDICLVKRASQVNYLHRFVTTGLRDTLETNLLEATSYTLPHNKRVKSKTHRRYKDLGIMKEYYELLSAQGVLI